MNVFEKEYLPKIEELLGKKLTDWQKQEALTYFQKGWHPINVANWFAIGSFY